MLPGKAIGAVLAHAAKKGGVPPEAMSAVSDFHAQVWGPADGDEADSTRATLPPIALLSFMPHAVPTAAPPFFAVVVKT